MGQFTEKSTAVLKLSELTILDKHLSALGKKILINFGKSEMMQTKI